MSTVTLEVVEGPEAGRRLQGDLPAEIGRDGAAEFTIDDDLVSWRHARFVAEGSGVAIEDLGSSNGTFVNGKRIQTSTLLGPGATILLGASLFRVCDVTAADARPGAHKVRSGAGAVRRLVGSLTAMVPKRAATGRAAPVACEARPDAGLARWLVRSITAIAPLSAASTRAVAGALGVGIVFDGISHEPVGGGALTVFTWTLVIAIAVVRRPRRRTPQLLLAAAAILSVGLAVRSSALVALPLIVVVAACAVASASLAGDGALFDLSWVQVALRVVAAVLHAVLAPVWLLLWCRGLSQVPRRMRAAGIVRGMLLAIPVVLVFGALFASADPVFSGLFSAPTDVAGLLVHGALIVVGSMIGAAVLRLSLGAGALPAAPWQRPRVGATEAVMLLGGVAALFTAFVVTQVATTLGAGRTALAAQGVTYAQYARSGYVELLWAAALAGVLLLVAEGTSAADGRAKRAVRVLSVLITLLTLGVLGVAVRRLVMYDDAYGLSLTRFASLAGAAWMSVTLVALAAWVSGLGTHRRWIAGVLLVSTVGFAGGMVVVNPAAYVARYNLVHVQTPPTDMGYLGALSDDAIPDLVAALPSLSPRDAAALRRQLCARHREPVADAVWNWSAAKAADAIRRACPS